MFQKRLVCLIAAICCLAGLCAGASAAEVASGEVYCFTAEEFTPGQEPLSGICILELPDASVGTVMLGKRVLRSGDILTAQQMAQMTFAPLKTELDQDAVMTYLPIFEDRVEKQTTMTIAVRGREDKAPVAQDSALETYKNLPNEGKLKVSDPEGQTMTYTMVRQPKRGAVELREDGTFTYTPKKNKVGTDSFVFTATDPAGNVSREATVTVQILKPADAPQYTDTVGSDCRFAAEWMKNTGLFVGEQIGGSLCFREDQEVSRGEFLTMLVNVLNIPVEEETSFTGYTDEAPQWLKPYLTAALRSGLTAGLPANESGAFGANTAVTGGEVAVMVQNALDLPLSTCTMEDAAVETDWATAAVAVMHENGIALTATQVMTRGQVAQLLYQVSCMAKDAASLAMYQ